MEKFDYRQWAKAIYADFRGGLTRRNVETGILIFLIWLVLTQLVPDVMGFFKESGDELPQWALWLIATSDFVQNRSLAIFLALVAGAIVMRVMIRKKR